MALGTSPEKPDSNRIENLERNLYSRSGRPLHEQTGDLHVHHAADVPDDWADRREFDKEADQSYAVDLSYETEHVSTFSKRLLYLSLAFFVIAISVGAFFYFRGANIISSNNIDISVTGPITIGGGQELDLEVNVKNQNTSDLGDATLKVDYPDGTQNPQNISESQLHTNFDLGPIASGGSATQKISAVFFGEQNSEKDITLTLDYQVKNSNATFEKTKTVPIEITSSPVTVNISSLMEVNSGQDLELDVNVVSNSQSTLQNLLMTGQYPFGFVFENSSPAPLANSQNAAWFIGTLAPGQSRTIKVIGKIQGQNGEDRAFQFAVGAQSQQSNIAINPEFISATQTVSIAKPFIGVDLSLDGSTGATYTTNPGQVVQGDLTWVNNSPDKVTGAKITLTFAGATLDKTSVQANQGFYDSNSNSITWDETTNPDLTTISPGDTGQLSFDFASLPPTIGTFSNFKNATIGISINVSGQRSDSVGVPNQVLSTVTRTINLDSTLAIVPSVVYTDGPFKNSGPIPPQVGKTTTYTVILAVTNTFNDASGVKVTGTLPNYVKWLGQISPSSETVTYDPTTGDIEWDPGSVPAGTGFSTSPRQVAFQVSLTPSTSQVNTVPVLLNNIALIGTDSFTKDSLSADYSPLTTKTGTDSTYQFGSETVRP